MCHTQFKLKIDSNFGDEILIEQGNNIGSDFSDKLQLNHEEIN